MFMNGSFGAQGALCTSSVGVLDSSCGGATKRHCVGLRCTGTDLAPRADSPSDDTFTVGDARPTDAAVGDTDALSSPTLSINTNKIVD